MADFKSLYANVNNKKKTVKEQIDSIDDNRDYQAEKKELSESFVEESDKKSDTEFPHETLVEIPLDLLDENPDNEETFGMGEISDLANDIDGDDFFGGIIVFDKGDGRFEICSGHRRARAMKDLDKEKIPAIIYPMPDDVTKAKRLIDFNIYNRIFTPYQWSRALNLYYEKVAKPEGKTNKIEACVEHFPIKKSMVVRYLNIGKMIPEIQELCKTNEFPFSGLDGCGTLTEKKQKVLYNKIRLRLKSSDEDEISLTKAELQRMIKELKNSDGSEEGSKSSSNSGTDSGSNAALEMQKAYKKAFSSINSYIDMIESSDVEEENKDAVLDQIASIIERLNELSDMLEE